MLSFLAIHKAVIGPPAVVYELELELLSAVWGAAHKGASLVRGRAGAEKSV